MLLVLKQVSVLYIFIILGWVFGKMKKEHAENNKILSFLMVTLFLPSKVFGNFSTNFTVDYLKENYVMILISFGILLMMVGLAWVVSLKLTKNPYGRNVYRYSLTISNYAYMGYVLMENFYGDTGLTNMLLFCIPFAIYTYTFGYAMLTGSGNLLKKLVNPMTGALVLGIIFGLFGIPVPAVLKQAVSYSSACMGPISMIMTGLVLSSFAVKELVAEKAAYAFCFVRLIALPAIVFVLCKALGAIIPDLPTYFYPSAMLMSCMPCGLNTVVFPKLVGEDCRTGARVAFMSHLFACITVPLWLSLIV